MDPALREQQARRLEGLDRHDDAGAVAAMAQRGGRQARCIVPGRHAPHDKLDHWLQVAAPVPGRIGFAIGRSIWWDVLHAHLHHRGTPGRPGAGSAAPTWTTSATTSAPATGCWPASPIRSCGEHATGDHNRGVALPGQASPLPAANPLSSATPTRFRDHQVGPVV